MRYIALFVLTAMLLLGCTGSQGSPPAGGGSQQAPSAPSGGSQDGCTPSYSFSDIADGTLSQMTSLVGSVTCAANKTIEVKLNGNTVASVTPETDAVQPVKLEFAPVADGTNKLTVESDGEVVFSRDWNVVPLGSSDIKGVENDAVSFKEWRAMAVDVGSPINAGRVRAYIKRLDFKTQPGTNIIVQLRKDSGGAPGELVSSVKTPINATTLSENWLNFDFPDKPALSKGTYWIVFKIEQTQDVNLVSDRINIHYVPNDKQAPGNDYTREMILDVDLKSGLASETQWQPLSYDRTYAIVLQSAK
jgi:hypothetical protein